MSGFGLRRAVPANGRLLLISCSNKKQRKRGLLPARERYRGSLFRYAIGFADRYGFRVLILSAKYGFIACDEPILYYDQKLQSVYDGSFPDGEGYYIGSSLYFGNAPVRFQRLLPEGLPIGKQVALLKRYIREGWNDDRHEAD